jgi:hypothetical protein
MTEPEVTLKDVWELLCSMDQSINERFDRLEGRIVAMNVRLAAFETRVSGVDEGIGAQLSALTEPYSH